MDGPLDKNTRVTNFAGAEANSGRVWLPLFIGLDCYNQGRRPSGLRCGGSKINTNSPIFGWRWDFGTIFLYLSRSDVK